MKPVHILYHADCPDGFGAAFVCWTVFGETAVYQPVKYGQPLPQIPDYAIVFIVDFSYPRPVLEELAARTVLTVIDHHKTAQSELAGLPFAHFDMDHSGAVLTWLHFNRDKKEAPALLRYVEDRDLWRFHLPESRAVNLSLWRGQSRDWPTWQAMAALSQSELIDTLAAQGRAIETADQHWITSLCARPVWKHIGSWTVPSVNSPVLQSEIGQHLLDLHPSAPFAAIWSQGADHTRVYSLRARHNDFDVSVVAKAFGGGGHRSAAGFTLHIGTAPLTFPQKKEAPAAP